MVLFHIQEAFMRPSRLVKDVMRNLVYSYLNVDIGVRVLYATTFGRTTTVVGQRGNVDDLGNLDSGSMYGTYC